MPSVTIECPECRKEHTDAWDGRRDQIAVVYCDCGACFSLTLRRREDHDTPHYTSGRKGIYRD